MSSTYQNADAKGICDRCGFEYPLSQLRKEWTGLRVCRADFDRRHPQEFVRGVPDNQALKDPRPEPASAYQLDPISGPVPVLDLDFTTQTYLSNLEAIELPLNFSRPGQACLTEADGITAALYEADIPRVNSRGLYLQRATNRLSTYPTDQFSWSIVGNATKQALTAISLFLPVLAGTGTGSTASVLTSNTNIALAAGQSVAVKGLYKAGTSGRARIRVSTAAAQSRLAGLVGALQIAEESAGTWSNVRNIILGNGWYLIEAVFTAGSTRSDYRLSEGPDSSVAGQNVVFAASQLTNEVWPNEWVFGPLSAPGAVPGDIASISVGAYSPTAAIFKLSTGGAANDATLALLSGQGTPITLLLDGQTGAVTASLGSAVLQLGAMQPAQTYTIALEWRDSLFSAQMDGNDPQSGVIVGDTPKIQSVSLFPSGGTSLTLARATFYNKAL